MSEKKEEWEIGYSKEHPPIKEEKTSQSPINAPSTDNLVGQTLDGRFLIEKDLTEGGADEGGIGLVYLAKDMKLLGKEAVVKILKKESLKNEDIERKFLHEKEALIRLDHPNIVRILDSGTLSDGNPFMVMEFIPGYSLRKVLKQEGQLSFDFAAHIIRKVTDGLSAAHSEKIIHRDIKPENIMLTPQENIFDRVRLIDFGIARVEESKLAPQTTTSRGIGTVLYMSPEQLDGQIEQTPAADIYAFAIVIHEMLTGEKPFQPKSLIEMYRMQQEGLENPPSHLRKDLPKQAEGILVSAFAFAASDRPQNARQFGSELADALSETITKQSVVNPHIKKQAEVDFNQKSLESDSIPMTEAYVEKVRSSPQVVEITQESKAPEVTRQTKPKNGKLLVWAGLGVLLFAVFSGLAAFVGWQMLQEKPKEENSNSSIASNKNETIKNSNNKVSENANKQNSNNKISENTNKIDENLPQRKISYYLMVQKMRNGKPFEKPFCSSGREIFETGYKFKMFFKNLPAGHFYLFNEGKDGLGFNNYNILFPTPVRNNGVAEVKENQTIETGENNFAETRGTEYVWIIWTKEKQTELEEARKTAYANEGKVGDVEKAKLLTDFLEKNKEDTAKAEKDSETQSTLLSGKGDILIYKIELEHR